MSSSEVNCDTIYSHNTNTLAITDTDRSLTVGELWVQSLRPVIIITIENLYRATDLGFRFDFKDGGGI